MVEDCTAALAKQPAVADCCIFADDMKAISKLAGTNAVAVGRLVKVLAGGVPGGWKWSVSDYRCFPVLAAAPAAAGGGARAVIPAD
jgi:hypothetical protein